LADVLDRYNDPYLKDSDADVIVKYTDKEVKRLEEMNELDPLSYAKYAKQEVNRNEVEKDKNSDIDLLDILDDDTNDRIASLKTICTMHVASRFLWHFKDIWRLPLDTQDDILERSSR
jgi:hypothetical protein